MLDVEFIRDNWLFIAMGISTTLGVTLVSLLFATAFGLIVAKGRRSSILPIRALSTFYVWLLDGIPLLLQIFFVFLALPELGIFLSGFWAAVFVLTTYYSVRMSDIFIVRFTSMGKTWEEVFQSLTPAMACEFAAMIKDSTLIAMTGFLHDVFWRAIRVGRAEFKNLEAMVIAAVVYLLLITVISYGLGARKFRLPVNEPPADTPTLRQP